MYRTIPTTSFNSAEPPEQGSYTAQLRTTLERQTPFVKRPGTRAVLVLACRTIPTASVNSAEPSEQGGYTVQLCATLDRGAPFRVLPV